MVTKYVKKIILIATHPQIYIHIDWTQQRSNYRKGSTVVAKSVGPPFQILMKTP